MAPILERAIALALRVPLSGLFLGKMSLAVRHNLAHVINFGIVIPRGLATWVVLQNIHDLPTTNLTYLVSVSGLGRVASVAELPLMTDSLARFTSPSRCLRLFLLEPLPKLIRGHINKLIELASLVSATTLIEMKIFGVDAYLITVSLSFTILNS
jgi:hypothetical protein